ncbi:unnamed protein product [Bursaphelenchus xylophilus]|uniref:(pine wood nematode) hypothetical protein n=1 Tax=Bursaphelenchus xylophilus TaxID=6326 RepID=A0A1I7SW70_BURXY|nr:unnamed protein product [Bursaphelenchus xylophilus]CAG9098922.1 unnamed protein product [Bursaphelenchus xylophilus]
MLAQRRKFFEDLIEKEKQAKARSIARIRPKKKIVFPKAKAIVSNVISEIPEKVLKKILDNLDYKEQCRLERVSKKWQRVVLHKQTREIKELVIEMTGSTIQALQQLAFQRLSISAPRQCVESLSGILRRCSSQLERLTCDLSLLCMTSKMCFSDRKYFNIVESLWLVVAKCNEKMLEKLRRTERDLFTGLNTLTLQVHVNEYNMDLIADLIQIFTNRRPNLILNLEIHASSGSKIAQQINNLPEIRVNKLKLVCSALNCAILSVPLISESLQKAKISFKNISFREWYITFDDKTPISKKPLRKLSFNSCTVYRSDELVEAIYITWSQKKKRSCLQDEEKRPVKSTLIRSNSEKRTKNDEKQPKAKRAKSSFLRKLEMAGSCTVVDLDHMKRKAHIELTNRISAKCPTLTIDTSDIFY